MTVRNVGTTATTTSGIHHHPSPSTPPPRQYDVVIVGAGPAGLATLSALQESFTLDHLTDPQRNQILSVRKSSCHRIKNPTKTKKKVCVIDPSGDWMVGWKENFSKLDITFLRSPALAHPDAFDENALLAFAVSQGREKELLASGCSDVTRLRGLGEAYNGLWHLPSSRLFLDFCAHTAKNLTHDFVTDAVVDIQKVDKTNATSNATRTSTQVRTSLSIQWILHAFFTYCQAHNITPL